MGTKIQSNRRYLSGYCSIWGLNESVNNDILSLYHDGKALKNGQHYDPVLPQKLVMGRHLRYDKEKVRQMILEHELTFRHQLQELHRLYGRQREIMKEFKIREVKNSRMEPETSHSSSFLPHISSEDTKPTWQVSHTSLLHSLLDRASALQNFSLPSSRKGKIMLGPFPSRDEGSSEPREHPNSNGKMLRIRMFDLEMPADVYMNDEDEKLEKNFCGLHRIESASTTSIHEIQHNKDVNHHQNGDALRSKLCFSRNNQLADLNEPIPLEEISISAIIGKSGNVACASTDIQRADISANSNPSPYFAWKDISLGSAKERNSGTCSICSQSRSGKEQLGIDFKAKIMTNDGHPSSRDAYSKASQAKLRRDEFSSSDQVVTKRKMKRKLFGVDIFEENDEPLGKDPSMANFNMTSDVRANDLLPNHTGQEALPKSFEGSDCLNWNSANVLKTANKITNVIQDVVVPDHNILNADCQSEQNDSKGSLPCFTGIECGQHTRTNKNSCHLNLASLQYSCQQFFQKKRTTSLSSQILNQKQETTSPHLVQDAEQRNIAVDQCSNAEMINCSSVSNSMELSFAGISSKEICFVADSNNSGHVLVEKAVSKDEPKAGDLLLEERINKSLSGLRQHIDLNLSLIGDEASPAPSLPSTIVRIARTEIDLEASMILQSEADTEINLSPDEYKEPHEELVKIAAEAMVAISLSGAQGTFNVATTEPLEAEAAACGHLSWLAELVSSYKCDDLSSVAESNVDGAFTDGMIPEGMDYFEFMTLNLKDAKEDNYYYRPIVMENENEDNEETKVTALSRGPRRGQARKGRQRKDFQRDILPSLVTLSKHEVAEDFQILEELFKSNGCAWQSSLLRKSAGKSSRRRKSSNSGVSTSPLVREAICPSLEQRTVSGDMQVEEKTLCGWGKRTRRLPRQRSMDGSHTFQLKP